MLASPPQDTTLEGEARDLRVGRLQRQKVRVSRNRIFDSAPKVFTLPHAHKQARRPCPPARSICTRRSASTSSISTLSPVCASSPQVLEIEFFGEVGTGVGPTLEFYTLLSREFQRKSLGLWRTEEAMEPAEEEKQRRANSASPSPATSEGGGAAPPAAEELVVAPHGLFPLPLHPSAPADASDRRLRNFRLLGRVIAKAIQDGRLLDLPLSAAFYRLLLGKQLDLLDVSSFDPALGATLLSLRAVADAARALRARGAPEAEIEALEVNGARVSDLCLSFTLPGSPDWALCPGGEDVAVTASNLSRYLDAVVDALVGAGVAPLVDACRQGFQELFPPGESLRLFAEEELDVMLCGREERWDVAALVENIKFDHGYTSASPPVVAALQVLTELGQEDQRAFLRFVTGAPRLPPGGLAALQPKLTIVCKHPTGGGGAGPSINVGAGDGARWFAHRLERFLQNGPAPRALLFSLRVFLTHSALFLPGPQGAHSAAGTPPWGSARRRPTATCRAP